MTRPLLAVAALAAATVLAGCALDWSTVRVVRDERAVAPFDRIAVEGRTDVTVRRGASRSVVLHGAEDVLATVTTSVRDGRLSIDRGGQLGAPLAVAITVPRVRGVDANGAGTIDLVDVRAAALELRNDGAGKFIATGRVGELEASVDGVGSLRLAGLAAERATVRVDGLGTAEVRVARALDATVAGVGEIRYHGDPVVRRTVPGLGGVRAAR